MEATHVSPEPVISETAKRWLDGGLDSVAYFGQARRDALARATAAVQLRLRRDGFPTRSGRWGNGLRAAR